MLASKLPELRDSSLRGNIQQTVERQPHGSQHVHRDVHAKRETETRLQRSLVHSSHAEGSQISMLLGRTSPLCLRTSSFWCDRCCAMRSSMRCSSAASGRGGITSPLGAAVSQQSGLYCRVQEV